MAKPREQRIVRPTEVRVAEDGHTVEAIVLTYNVVDDYNTLFRPGVFAESLEARMPRMCWGHDWRDPIGRWTEARDTATELTLVGELDDFDAVPRARQAAAQLASGTIDQFSVGFVRTADELVDPDDVDGLRGVYAITKGVLDETSLVLVGAVPGTKLLAVRSGLMVPEEAVMDLAKRVVAGEMTKEEAKAALDLLSTETETDEAGGGGGAAEDEGPTEEEQAAAAAELDADVDAALALLDRSALR